MITIQDLQVIIALLIKNNKPAFIQAMNATGNYVSANITDDDLFQKVFSVYDASGLNGIKNILSRVPLIKSTLTSNQQAFILKVYAGNPNAKCGFAHPLDCIQSAVDIIAGSSTVDTTGPSSSSNSTPVLSPTALVYIAIIAFVIIVILLIVFRKSLSLIKWPILAIIGIVALVILYGTFAKKTTTSTTPGGTQTQTHGSIVSSLLAVFGL